MFRNMKILLFMSFIKMVDKIIFLLYPFAIHIRPQQDDGGGQNDL